MNLPTTLDLGETECTAMVFEDALQYVTVERDGACTMLLPFQLICLMGQAEFERFEQALLDEYGRLLEEERVARNARIMGQVA